MAIVLLPVHAAMLFSLVGAIVWVKLFDFLARREVLNQVRRSFKQAADLLALQMASSQQCFRYLSAHKLTWQASKLVRFA